MNLAENYRVNTLLEFYRPLLTPKQRKYMQSYYVDDFSLGEISQNFQVSRQAVYDNLNRTEKTLMGYERRLHLYRNFRDRNRLIDQMQAHVSRYYPRDHRLIAMIKDLECLENR